MLSVLIQGGNRQVWIVEQRAERLFQRCKDGTLLGQPRNLLPNFVQCRQVAVAAENFLLGADALAQFLLNRCVQFGVFQRQSQLVGDFLHQQAIFLIPMALMVLSQDFQRANFLLPFAQRHGNHGALIACGFNAPGRLLGRRFNAWARGIGQGRTGGFFSRG